MQPTRWQKIKDLLIEAEGVPEASRTSWLRNACGSDAVLYKEVAGLLLAEDQDTNELAQPLHEIGEPVSEDFTGLLLGSWRLVRELGYGGMGTVWLAERADEAFRMEAAIKLIRTPMVSNSMLNRFLRERQFLADLKHPNIAALLDGGATPDGLPYMVMEYVEGQTIDTWCQSQDLTPEEILVLFDQVCHALAYAHGKGVLHRDIKPANIMVSPGGVVKLMDFGIAFRENDEQTALTLEGYGPMTLEYASPEQLRGMPASAASDIYALGLVLLELLCRKPPRMLINNATLELGIFIQRQSHPEAWRDLGELIPRMLAYDPADRPSSAEKVQKRLKRLPEHTRERLVDKENLTALTAIRHRQESVPKPARPLKPYEPKLAIVKAGAFLMGREPGEGTHGWETPRHQIDLSTYQIGIYPVTNAQYAAFLDACPEHMEPGEKAGWLHRTAPPDKLDHPVVAVNFFDALAYCDWLSKDTGKKYLLPTEAQWEKATGAQRDQLFPWVGPWDDNRCHVNALTTAPVTSYENGKSNYGCFHMIGNVQEWTRTQWGEDPGESSFPYPYRHDDGRNNIDFGNQQPFVIHRGGSYRDEPTRLDCRARGLSHPSGKFLWRGFRVAMEESP